jgi:hypothetical protein
MLRVREYDPAEFELATWTSNSVEAITFNIESEDMEYFQGILNAACAPYTSIDDVLRHAVYRHVSYLLKLVPIVRGNPNYSRIDSSDVQSKILLRQDLQEINFGLILDFMDSVMQTCLSERCFNAVFALEELLKCAVRRMRSRKLKELYMEEIKTRWVGVFHFARHETLT